MRNIANHKRFYWLNIETIQWHQRDEYPTIFTKFSLDSSLLAVLFFQRTRSLEKVSIASVALCTQQHIVQMYICTEQCSAFWSKCFLHFVVTSIPKTLTLANLYVEISRSINIKAHWPFQSEIAVIIIASSSPSLSVICVLPSPPPPMPSSSSSSQFPMTAAPRYTLSHLTWFLSVTFRSVHLYWMRLSAL